MAWSFLHTGQGSLDWAGLPVVVEYLGITDVEGLLTRLQVIKRWANETEQQRREAEEARNGTRNTDH